MPQDTEIFRSLFVIIDFLSVSPGMLTLYFTTSRSSQHLTCPLSKNEHVGLMELYGYNNVGTRYACVPMTVSRMKTYNTVTFGVIKV